MMRLANVCGVVVMTLAAGVQARQSAAPGSAEELLDRVANAYRQAATLQDDVSITISGGGVNQVMSVALTLDGNHVGRFSWSGWTFTGVGDQFFMMRDHISNKYMLRPMVGTFHQTLVSQAGSGLPVPHFSLRYGETLQQRIDGFGMGNLTGLKLDGLATVNRDGVTRHELKMTSAKGDVTALVDPATMFLAKMEIVIGATNVDIVFNPRVYDELPEPVSFDTGDRKQVQVIRLEQGDPAPDFELPTLSGETVKLSELRGSMVVLDFWASWCGPCLRGLPQVDMFAKWARSEGKPVHVFAINSFERVRTDEEKRSIIERVWKAKGFRIPTLLDFTMGVARDYEVGPIPHSVVIDPEGNIHEVNIGFTPRIFDDLKRTAGELLDEDG